MSRPTIIYVNLRRPPLEVREALLAARRVGCDVVLLADKAPDYVRPYVEAVELVDTFDVDAAVAAARSLADRFPVQGVVTWSERDVELVAEIGLALGLPALDPKAARRARHKFEMKQALAPLGDLTPRHALVRTREELRAALARVPLPAILKPAGASGSKGIYDVRTLEEAERAFDALQSITTPSFDPIFRQFGSDLVLEEYVDGKEVAACGWVFDGTPTVISISDTVKSHPWYFETRGIYPTDLAPAAYEQAAGCIRDAAKAIGLDHCAFYVDGIIDDKGFRLIEIGGRPSGDYHGSHVVPLALGIDFYADVLRIALGRAPLAEPRADTCAGYQFLTTDSEGVFERIDGLEDVLALPEIDRISFETPVGTVVRQPPRQFGSGRVAAVLASAPEREQLERALDQVAELARVVVRSS